MPFVKMYVRHGRNVEALRAIADGVHAALVKEANVPPDDRFQVIHQLKEEEFFFHPGYAGMNRTSDLVIIQITLNMGRTTEIKKNLYAAIARNLQADPGIRPDDILVNLVEVRNDDWSFGKGLATYA